MRICSLLPSATEIVYSLGLGDDLVAVTHECDYPPEAAGLPVVTRSSIDHGDSHSGEIHSHIEDALHSGSSIYKLDLETLERVDPELILTQELCDVCAVSYGEVKRAVRLLDGERPVLSLEPTDLEGILDTVNRVAEKAGVPERGKAVVAGLRERVDRVRESGARASARPRVFALEWLDPPFVAGHWVPQMIRMAGGEDVLGKEARPSVQVGWEDVERADPEVVVVMPCGFDSGRALEELTRLDLPSEWRRLRAVREGRVFIVDGSAYFNRPGPRIVDGLEILGEILLPELFPRKSPPGAWSRAPDSR